MDSVGVVLLILAIVFMLALMYLCCWWYCTQRRCFGSSHHKKVRNGPAYIRADSLPREKEAHHVPSNNNNNNNAAPFQGSMSVPDSKVKYPTAPAVDEPKILKEPSLALIQNRYGLKGLTTDLKLQNTAPPSPPIDKKISSGSLLSTPGYAITQMKERSYQPLVGYDSGNRKLSMGTNNSTITSTLATRNLSHFSEKTDAIPWMTEKRSVSPYRATSPFSSRYSTASNSEINKYTNIRTMDGTTTTTTTKSVEVSGGDDEEQTVTIKVKADEADKVSSIINNAVRRGELSGAEAVHESKTVDVKKMTERYEGGGNESSLDLKTDKTDRLPSFVPTIITTSMDGQTNVKDVVEQVMSSVTETAPGYTVSKHVIISSKEEGKVTETQITKKESSASLDES